MELIKIEDDWRCDFEDTFDHEPLIVLYKRIEYKYNKHALLDNILAIEFRMRRLRDIDDIFKSQLIKWVENSIPRTFKKMLVFSIFYILNLECAILQGNATVKIFLTNGNFISADYSYKPAKDQPNFIEFVAKDQKNSIEIFFTFLHNDGVTHTQTINVTTIAARDTAVLIIPFLHPDTPNKINMANTAIVIQLIIFSCFLF